MKREGRPHGTVRTFAILPDPLNPRPAARMVNRVDSPPVAGIFARIPAKPTNHSKFTGKCEKARCSGCHIHPVGKSRGKSKGTQKSRSSEAALNYKLVTWRVMSGHNHGLRNLPVASRHSASKILDELDIHDHQVEYDDDDHGNYDDGYGDVENCDDEVVEKIDEDGDEVIGFHNVNDDYDCDDYDEDGEEDVSFYDVGVVWDPLEDDEGWSIVVAGR